MLKGIDPVISPQLLKILDEMGHGSEILLADGNYPAQNAVKNGSLVIRADGIGIPDLLEAALKLLPLDTFVDYNVVLMIPEKGTPEIWKEYERILKISGEVVKTKKVPRFEFYDLAAKSYAVVASGERALYANIILKKGVVNPS
ncbi:MAG: RbsD/FucU family protein [Thermotogae bacterium]|jgi:L-fucose mutarotase|nr:RbsD/FucU family protein [Thermotogota bacterium]MCL5032206.1 RbsD/FucU family protein [Thermotogota bacterium]